VRRQSLIALGVAIFLGLVAVFLVNSFLRGAEKKVEAVDTATVNVAVATVAMPFGTAITPEKVRFVNWPRASVPPGAFNSVGDLLQGTVPRVVLRPLDVGEPILRTKISGEGGRATLSAILPPERRAVSIRISDVAGVAGFVLPGDRVDIILLHAVGEGQVADVMLQDVRVIAIDQDANDQANRPALGKTATVEVQPYDAQKLALAQQAGTLTLALRSASAQAGEGYTERVGIGDLTRGSGPRPRPASTVPNYATPPLRIRKPVHATASVTSNVEVVRGTAGSNYEVGAYAGK